MSQIAEIIKYEGDNSTFIWKHPKEDFNSLTQLIVHESQEAIFFMNGQALDLFGPGRYTLETQNIPQIGKLLNRTTGGDTPFHCEVYFINKTVQMAIKWGTDSKVRFIEPTYNLPIEIGASGELNLAVSDARKLLVKLVGTMKGIAWQDSTSGFTKSISASFRPLISTMVKAHLSATIKENNIDVLEIDEHLVTLSDALKKNICEGFEEYGLTIPEFYVTNVVLPEEDKNFQTIRELHTISLQTRKAQFDVAVEIANRQVTLEKETTATERLRREAERDIIRAQTKAEAEKAAGFAEAEVMRAKGYNEKDVLQAEVQKAYAEGIGNMTINGSGGGVAGDMIGLGVGMAAAGAIAPQMGEMFKGFNSTATGNNETTQTTLCPNCNSQIPAQSKFCLQCGTRVEAVMDNEIICPTCGKKTPKGKFCMECGSPLALKCSKCGADIPTGAKFCLECGEKL